MGLVDLGKELRISQRPLDIIYVIDTSLSMKGAKIQSVNNAMHELETLLRGEAKSNPTAQLNVRILTFGGDKSKWHLEQRTKIEDFYYLYNEENKYYYVVPVGTDWIHIENVKEVKKTENGKYYTITCSTSFSEDGLSFYDSGDVKVTLKHCPENKYIRYQLVKMEHTKGTLEEI